MIKSNFIHNTHRRRRQTGEEEQGGANVSPISGIQFFRAAAEAVLCDDGQRDPSKSELQDYKKICDD